MRRERDRAGNGSGNDRNGVGLERAREECVKIYFLFYIVLTFVSKISYKLLNYYEPEIPPAQYICVPFLKYGLTDLK